MEGLREVFVFVAGMLVAFACIAFGIVAHVLLETYRSQRELRRMRTAIRHAVETGQPVDCDGMRYHPPGRDGRPVVEKLG
jgi:hypothetical protein